MKTTQNTADIIIRRATDNDVAAIVSIYNAIIDREAAGQRYTGWQKDVYPTAATVRTALAQNDMYVLEADGIVRAAARLNQEQVPVYADCPWLFAALPHQVFVIHTLVVDPACAGRGIATQMLAFYERLARDTGCTVLRLDTNATNLPARRLYVSHGYREAGIVPCTFNGIPGVQLVCLEKQL